MIEIHPLAVDVEIDQSHDLATLVTAAAPPLRDGDVVAATHKAVSKNEGRVVVLDQVEPSARAIDLAGDHSDPRVVEVVLQESRRVLRVRGPLLVTETHSGLVCANAGVDQSNAPRPGTVVLLPLDPDASAARLRAGLARSTGVCVGVLVVDTMGRAWRHGIVGTAIGAAGVECLRDLTGVVDASGRPLRSTVIAIADELAAAADLAFGKRDRVPFALIRGAAVAGDATASEIIRPAERDLFR